jgi:nitroreductase
VEIWDAISRLRAIRSFADQPLDPSHVDRILRAGRRAPSSKNTQRWAFVVCQDRQHLAEVSKVGPFAGHIAGAAAAVAIVTPDAENKDQRGWIMLDAGQVAQNMMLAAWDLGVGSAHAAVYDSALAQELLGYPNEQRCDLIISLGYPADPAMTTRPPGKGGRQPFEEIVHWERW